MAPEAFLEDLDAFPDELSQASTRQCASATLYS